MNTNTQVNEQSETANAHAQNAYASTESQDSPALPQGSVPALEAGQTQADTSLIPEDAWEDYDQEATSRESSPERPDPRHPSVASSLRFSATPEFRPRAEAEVPEPPGGEIEQNTDLEHSLGHGLDRLVRDNPDIEIPDADANGTALMSGGLDGRASAHSDPQAVAPPIEHGPTPRDGEDTDMTSPDEQREVIYAEWKSEGKPRCHTCRKRHPPPCRHAPAGNDSEAGPSAAPSVPKRRLDGDADGDSEPPAPGKRQRQAKQPSRREAGLPKLWCRDCEAEHPWPDRDGTTHHIRTRAESAHARNLQRQGLIAGVDPNAFGANAPLRITAPPAAPQPAAPAQQPANPQAPQMSQSLRLKAALDAQTNNNEQRSTTVIRSMPELDQDNRMRMLERYLDSHNPDLDRFTERMQPPAPAQPMGPSYASAAALTGLASGQTLHFPGLPQSQAGPVGRPGYTPGQTLQLPQRIRAPQPPRGAAGNRGRGHGRGGRGNGRGRGNGNRGGSNATNRPTAGTNQPNAPGANPQGSAGTKQPNAPGADAQGSAGTNQPNAPGANAQAPAGNNQLNAPGANAQVPAGNNQPSSADDRRTNIVASSGPHGLGKGHGAARR